MTGGGGFVVVVIVVTTTEFEYIFPLRVIIFKGSLFPKSDLTKGELAGGFLKSYGRVFIPFFILWSRQIVSLKLPKNRGEK